MANASLQFVPKNGNYDSILVNQIFQNGSLGLRTKQKRKKLNVENVLLLCGGARI